MASVTVLPPTRRLFRDPRDDARALRVTWHPGDDMFVLSLWRDGACAATFRLDRAETPALVQSLVENLARPVPAEWTDPSYTAAPRRHVRDLVRRRRPADRR